MLVNHQKPIQPQTTIMGSGLGERVAAALGDGTQPEVPVTEPVAEIPPAPDSAALQAELNETRRQLEAVRQEHETTKKSANTDKIRNALLDAARQVNAFDPATVADLLQSQLRLNGKGDIEVVAETGVPRLNSSYTPMTLPELVQEFAQQKPYLIRSTVKSGTGSSESQRFYGPEPPISRYFGRGSDGAAANKLKKTNSAECARLKAIAREKGLI